MIVMYTLSIKIDGGRVKNNAHERILTYLLLFCLHLV